MQENLHNPKEVFIEKPYWDDVKDRGMVRRSPNHPVVKFYSKQRLEYLKEKIELDSVKTCLDVACGTGFSSFHLPLDKQITGIDFSYRLLKINPLKSKIQGSGYSLPFRSNSFDLVFGWEFLHHLDNPEKVLSEMVRVTKKYLVLFEPNRYNPVLFFYSLYNKEERRVLRYHKAQMLKLVNLTGLDLISCDTVGWVFAGSSPKFSLKICQHLPYKNKLGIAIAIICKKVIQ